MPFDTALSGIRAASSDLSVTGNNIANASTTGFKSSRAEFGDVYGTSVLGSGSNPIGSGVRLQDVAQQFTQGTVAFTENQLDLAINGNGMFVVHQGGEQLYTRAGTFGLDQDGYITNNTGARLQGFPADEDGNIENVQQDVRFRTGNLSPQPTTAIGSILNLDASSEVLSSSGLSFSTEGNAIGVARVGLVESTATTLPSNADFTLPLATDFTTDSITFDVELTASNGNNGTVSVVLDTSTGMPATINTFNDLRTLAGVLSAQLSSPDAPQNPIDVLVNAVDAGGGAYRLEFTSLQDGENSQIQVLNGNATAADLELPVSPAVSTSTPGVAKANNGYPSQSIDVIAPDGSTSTFTSIESDSASAIASALNSVVGVSASAQTSLRLVAGNYNNSAGNLTVTVNGVSLQSTNLAQLSEDVNAQSSSFLPGITASIDAETGDLLLSSSSGSDITLTIDSIDDGDSIEVLGNPNAPSEVLEVDTDSTLNIANATAAAGNAVVVGGTIDMVLEQGYSVSNPSPPATGLFSPLTEESFSEVVINQFDPTDPVTYNNATSITIYDSLGNSHVMTQYFVKESYNVDDPESAENQWTMYVQIDGQNVGEPDTTLTPPDNTLPTMASFNVVFNSDGSIDPNRTQDAFITNWTPVDASGAPNGSLGPINAALGSASEISEPPTSSNFSIDLDGTTQFGSVFSVNDVAQNGFTTGRLAGLNIDDKGVIFARFTNGESQTFGQIVLADFTNTQGLQPAGDTMWSENFESGPPSVGTPRSAALGSIQAGALEESNVDLSQELVNLIIAQRNFQANSKTIETANQVTQTIINLR